MLYFHIIPRFLIHMDIHLVRVQVGFIYEPLTAVRTEKPLV